MKPSPLLLASPLPSSFLAPPPPPSSSSLSLYRYVELDLELGASAAAAAAGGVVADALAAVVAELAFVIEARAHDEQPEVVLGAARLDRAAASDAVALP